MDKDTKTLLVALGVSIIILFIAKPKKSSDDQSILSDKYSEPKVADKTSAELKENAVTGMQAMRDAINNKESAKEIDKLKAIILQDYNIKIAIHKSTQKLVAMTKDGKVIAEEA